MKHLLKYLLAAAVLPLWGQAAADGPFGQLRGLCEPGKSVLLTAPTVVEGIVVSDYRSPNMELNPNLNYFSVDLEENDRTAYVEAADGSCGIRLRFDEASENRLARYDRVRLDLDGCRLTRTASPDCMTLTGVQALNVLSVAPGTAADLPLKERTVATLTDDDLYTFVTLRDAEFVFKEGSYTNIWEPYAQSCGELHHYKYDINNRMDGWASLVRDAEGGTIYMLVNTLCAWRRAGKPLPQGMGPLSGVVVHTPMRRYGGDMGRYAIRPLDERDIAIPRDTASSYAVVAEWNWDRNYDAAIRFEKQGYTPRVPKSGVAGDRVLPDAGEGFLSTTSGARMRLDTEYDTRYAQDGDGKAMRVNAALRLDSDTHDWFRFDSRGRMSGAEAVVVETSTEGIEGRGLSFDFSFLAGNHDINRSWGYPVEWKVEYSADGLPFIDAGRIFVLRPVVYNDAVIKDLGLRRLSYDAAPGFTEYSVPLPASLLGHKRLTVRLTPASAVMATIPENPADDSAGSVVTADFRQPFVLRLGRVAVRVLR